MILSDTEISHFRSTSPESSNDHLDDIFSSSPPRHAPTSDPANPQESHPSDIPRLRSQHSTAGYRDGISIGKAENIQAGFDEGYTVGAALGLKAGKLVGMLEGIVMALSTQKELQLRAREVLGRARKDLRVEELCGEKWLGADGLWTFEVEGLDAMGVADAHPALRAWEEEVKGLALQLVSQSS